MRLSRQWLLHERGVAQSTPRARTVSAHSARTLSWLDGRGPSGDTIEARVAWPCGVAVSGEHGERCLGDPNGYAVFAGEPRGGQGISAFEVTGLDLFAEDAGELD